MGEGGFGRRVVTGPFGVASDGPSPLTIEVPGSFAVSELLWLEGPLASVDEGVDRAGEGFPLEPPPGGASARLVRMPWSDDWVRVAGDEDVAPGLHATDTLDFMVVVEGAVVLGMADGSETTVRAGDAVVQRATAHRWRVLGPGPCTYFVTMLRPRDTTTAEPAQWSAAPVGEPRRLVTDGEGVVAGGAPVGVAGPLARLVDLWATGGPLTSTLQGGDADGPWRLDPPPGGVVFRWVELQPGAPRDAGWHRTGTVDVDVVLEGHLRLELPGSVCVDLSPGDAVLQRGTEHRWEALGGEPVRFAAVMFGLA